MTRIHIKEIYESMNKKEVPSHWLESQSRIEKDYAHLQTLLKKENPPKIYGVNTLVGHVDTEGLKSDEEINTFQKMLIQNHIIGTEPYFSDFSARCIGFVKINQISHGGTCISPELYQLLVKVIFDDHFKPKIPMKASYSSGDVIPGAHWAGALQTFIHTNQNYQLKPKEGISLINGSYVHAGYSLSILKEINNVWKHFVYNSLMNAILVQANRTNYTEHLTSGSSFDSISMIQKRLISLLKNEHEYKRQDPVSIRSLPQILKAFFSSINSLMESTEEAINSRSDNPLIVHESEIPLSQASFLNPLLTIETSKLIETLLMTMWHIERRVHYLLSGNVEGIPLNAASKEEPLGFIQIPKLITALLEEARMDAGRRAFASGGSTSYGIEDFWTFGVQTTHVLDKVVKKFAYMLSLEFIVSSQVYEHFHQEKKTDFKVPQIKSGQDMNTLSNDLRKKILAGENTFINEFIDIDFLK
jgi:histidine ammonia-lyase